jgi:hypothetical protein
VGEARRAKLVFTRRVGRGWTGGIRRMGAAVVGVSKEGCGGGQITPGGGGGEEGDCSSSPTTRRDPASSGGDLGSYVEQIVVNDGTPRIETFYTREQTRTTSDGMDWNSPALHDLLDTSPRSSCHASP